jgi:Ca2+-transporting ATPase
MPANTYHIRGLSDAEVTASRNKHGSNAIRTKKNGGLIAALADLVKEPMVILLLAAAAIYFVMGHTDDGIFMVVAIVLVAAISLFQESRSRNALEKLKYYTQPGSKVIRNGQVLVIPSAELVVGDSLIAEEGMSITADGTIVQANDFSVNESVLTGESMAVYKDQHSEDNRIYSGTLAVSGLAIVTVTAIGNATRLGQIGETVDSIATERTPLEKQIANFVKKMVVAGAIVFVIVWGINYYDSGSLPDSLLKALTIAMSVLPEEIPVAFTTFMALGAWRLMKMGIVVKQMKTVETLGSATVICTDKTGTITENKMALARLFVPGEGIVSTENPYSDTTRMLLRTAMFASEPIPFDPMETALHQAYTKNTATDERPAFTMVHEYPLGGKPPMMTHVFENKNGERIIAAKGAPEAIMAVSDLDANAAAQVQQALQNLAAEGFRVLAVAESSWTGNDFPEQQQELPFVFKGLLAFYDPPKANIGEVLQQFYQAGINVKIVTGDNAATTSAIAQQTGFRGYDQTMTGDELMALSETELQQKVSTTQVFTRMYPEAKLRIINALKANQEIVAMTGDGVNDGPALKAAHIGIAMGKKGTEIAKQAASLILLEDDLSSMIDAVAMGRKIYSNLKKAIQYIISIHIPIILTVFIPLAAGWIYPNIFSPVHIIFLELIMGPTCSIIYENEPIEKQTMQQQPRPFTTTFFNARELATSVVQGLVITAVCLIAYQYAVAQNAGEAATRTMVFTTLISANISLTLVNRSFYYSVFTTLQYRNRLIPFIIGITVLITAMLLYIPPLARFFDFETPSGTLLGISVGLGFAGAAWYELVKAFKRSRTQHSA